MNRHICGVQSCSTWYLQKSCSQQPGLTNTFFHQALAETLSVELEPFGVRVLHVAPGSFRTEGIYSNGFYDGNKLVGYDDIRAAAAKRFASVPGNEKGDPVKAMEVVVDVVRGEGVAKGKPWPGLLVLGEDSERDVRNKCQATLQMLDTWGDVAKSVNLDVPNGNHTEDNV